MIANEQIEHLDLDFPIDCILETDNFIVLCGYLYLNTNRSGCLYFQDKTTFEIIHMVETSGTLHACYKNSKLYLANSSDISIYKENVLITKKTTKSFNTYVCVDKYIYVADESGSITVYDDNLDQIDIISISKEPIWVAKVYENFLYFGNEMGFCYRFELETGKYETIGDKRLGIIDILVDSNNLIISSYDDNIEIFDKETLQIRRKILKTGSLWKILKLDDFFVCSSIYDGVKLFSKDFETLQQIKPSTICYGIHLIKNKLLWADFYDKKLLWAEFKK